MWRTLISQSAEVVINRPSDHPRTLLLYKINRSSHTKHSEFKERLTFWATVNLFFFFSNVFWQHFPCLFSTWNNVGSHYRYLTLNSAFVPKGTVKHAVTVTNTLGSRTHDFDGENYWILTSSAQRDNSREVCPGKHPSEACSWGRKCWSLTAAPALGTKEPSVISV